VLAILHRLVCRQQHNFSKVSVLLPSSGERINLSYYCFCPKTEVSILFNGSNRANFLLLPDGGSTGSFSNAQFLARNEKIEIIQHKYQFIDRMSKTVSTKFHSWMLT
jgi:hypothetical protein